MADGDLRLAGVGWKLGPPTRRRARAPGVHRALVTRHGEICPRVRYRAVSDHIARVHDHLPTVYKHLPRRFATSEHDEHKPNYQSNPFHVLAFLLRSAAGDGYRGVASRPAKHTQLVHTRAAFGVGGATAGRASRPRLVPRDPLTQLGDLGRECDLFDIICHTAFDMPPLTRKERAENVKKRNYFTKYGDTARAVLEALLDKYLN